MTEEDDLVLNIDADSDLEKIEQFSSFRDGNVFLIDATEQMFEIDPETETSYFSQCLETYKSILSEKLSWNKTDWMGIILFGTNKCDQDPEIKHVFTWQTFQEVSIDQLIKIEKTLENVKKFQAEVGSSTEYPLYDALWHAARCFSIVKIKMPFRNIILLTRSDNPCADDPAEKYRIRVKASDCANLNIRLSVVGLGKEWNPKHFFRELEVHSGKFDRSEDYNRTFLADLEEQVKHGSRVTAKLQWTLGNDVKLGVSISTITAKTKFPKKIYLKKENNEPLDGYSYFRSAEAEDDEYEDEDGETDRVHVALPENVYAYQEFGGREIRFSRQEVYRVTNSREPGINLLGFKPQSKLDLSLHLEAPKFVTSNELELEGSKVLFAALLKKCKAKCVMAICAVTLRSQSASYLYAMIPSSIYDGFYAYKLPFAENVRNFASIIPEYVYNETDHKCPIDEDTVDLCYKFIKKSSIAYDPAKFLNPKLHTELAHIESLAMDKESCDIPMDSTIPDKEVVRERLGKLRDRLEEFVRIHGKDKSLKRPGESSLDAPNKLNKFDFEDLVRDQIVEKCTVKELKDYLKSVGIDPVGRKGDLVNTVYSLFNKV